MDCPGAVPAAMRPVRVWNALRTTGERRATTRTEGGVSRRTSLVLLSGLNDWKASRTVSSGGISPFLGPRAVPSAKAACKVFSSKCFDHRLCHRTFG